MPRLALVLALLSVHGALLACGAPVVQPLDEAKRLEPTKAVPKDSKTEPTAAPLAATPPPPPAPAPGPYTRPGDRAQQRDELSFWGFSADGRRYAFETYYYGPGAAECEGLATLNIIDADTDTFVDGTPLEIKHRDPGADRCDPPDLRAEMARHREQLLHRHGIIIGNQGASIVPNRDSTSRGTTPTWILALPDGPLRAELEVQHGGRDNAGDPGASYTLTLRGPGDAPTIVEAGKRRRPFVWDYSLDGGVAFLAPDKNHLAIILTTKQLSFEGDRHSYMSNGLKTPPTAPPTAAPIP
jgi:predicted secreted protein